MLLAGTAAAQEEPAATPTLVLSFGSDPGLAIRVPSVLSPGGVLSLRSTPALIADLWEDGVRSTVARSRAGRFQARLLISLGLRADQVTGRRRRPTGIPRPEEFGIPTQRDEVPQAFRAVGSYANLGLDIRARIELKFDRLKNARCTAEDVNNPALGCQGGFPTPSFDAQFGVRAGGIVSDRVHINVDFDSEREFSANNNINVFYQGLEDEILRRVEIGNVTFRSSATRFVSAAIPGNSFGVQAEAQLGAMEFRTIIAQQKGSAIRTRQFTVGEETTQPAALESRDLDYVQERFFFVVNPTLLPFYPEVDILNISPETLPPDLQVAAVRVYRLRAQSGQVGGNANLGGIDAVAIRPDSPQQVGPFSWELLVEGRDYYLDPSGTWIALASQLGTDDFLAVSYVTAAGDTVGTFPFENGVLDTLELIHEPRRGPEVPTFNYGMRNVYRLAGDRVNRATLGLTLRVGASETPLGAQGTYLSRLGLALPTDESTLDEFNRVFPRDRDPGGGEPVRGLFVVFPHLTPFADSTLLQPAERSDSLYRTPTYLLGTQGPPPRYALQIDYEATGAGNRTNLNLGSIGMRSGSERLYVGDRLLERGRDYEIDYVLGQVTFLRPDAFFTGVTTVRAEFEENQLFDEAPKSIFGASGTYALRGIGEISAIGVFQQERTVNTRPILGFEPEAGFIGGLSADLEFRANGLTRALDALPLINTSVPSVLLINGEVALSAPNANRTGAAYIEDFDQEAAIALPLSQQVYQHGSRPTSGLGLPATYLGPAGQFEADDAVPLVWQNLVQTGASVLQFGPQDIDSTIRLIGSGVNVETLLWLSLKPDTVGGLPDPLTGQPRWVRPHTPGPRWRSITQPLGGGSGIGADLSRVEFLEFWVLEDAQRTARDQGAYMVFDFGTVHEDAVAFAPESLSVSGSDTTYSGFQFVGLDRLDTEKDSLTAVFNAQLDDVGIHGDRPDTITNAETGEILEYYQLCNLRGSGQFNAYPLGALDAQCTVANSFMDTEDLDGDNRLDVKVGTPDEEFVRYVFPIGGDEYHVRDGVTHLDGAGRELTWRLYRIPFRLDTLQVGQPNLRQVEGARFTIVAPDQGGDEKELWIALARLRLTGAPWLKRSETPLQGLGGSVPVPRGEVIASLVTTENTDLGYESPPGIGDLPDRVDAGIGIGQVQINEKSLRLLASELQTDERAEAFIRFTGVADKNFLNYRELRVWARGRNEGWSEGDLEFYIKVGRDEHNFYMYRVPARTDTWEPEVVIELDRWLELRAVAEREYLSGAPPSGAAACGGDSTAYIACDGPYLVQVRDPATAPPNLAAVSEVAVGMYRTAETVAIPIAELWVDDIRVTNVLEESGTAAAIDIRLSAADVAEVNVSLSRRDDKFRQLGENATYITDAATRVGGLFRVDKLLPESWGLVIPFTAQYTRTSADPYYVSRTDLLAEGLQDLRNPVGSVTSYQISMSRGRRGQSFLERTLVDPVTISAGYEKSENVTSLSSIATRNQQGRFQYALTPSAKTVAGAPGFLVSFVNSLPSWIKDSEFGKSINSSRLRWNPFQLRFTSLLTDNLAERTVYRVPIELPEDSLLRPLPSIVHLWRNDVGFDFRPFSTLTVALNYSSTRDLQHYGDSTTTGKLIELERRSMFGTDFGFERLNTIGTAFNVAPVLNSWLRPRFAWATNFSFNRNPNRRDPLRIEGDTAGAFKLAETLANSRHSEVGFTLDLARMADGLAGDSGFIAELFHVFLPADFTYTRDLSSSYDRAPFDSDLSYRLGWGGLGDFRAQNGIPATAARDATTLLLTAGAQLPLDLQLRVIYRDLEATVWQRRGDKQTETLQLNREWPSFTLTWAWTTPAPLQKILNGVLAQGQYREQTTSRTQPSALASDSPGEGSTVRTENNTQSFGPSLTLNWIGGVTTTGRYTMSHNENVTSGNITQSDRRDWSATLAFAFSPPASLVSLRQRIQTSLSFNSSLLAVCLLRTGTDECRTVSDSRRQQFDVRMDTGFSSMLRAGLSFSYIVSDQRHTSQKLTQTVFTVFGDLTLRAGEVR